MAPPFCQSLVGVVDGVAGMVGDVVHRRSVLNCNCGGFCAQLCRLPHRFVPVSLVLSTRFFIRTDSMSPTSHFELWSTLSLHQPFWLYKLSLTLANFFNCSATLIVRLFFVVSTASERERERVCVMFNADAGR